MAASDHINKLVCFIGFGCKSYCTDICILLSENHAETGGVRRPDPLFARGGFVAGVMCAAVGTADPASLCMILLLSYG